MSRKRNISAFILCGGKSSRMKREKGLVLLEGKTFVQRIIEAIQPVTDCIHLVTQNAEYAGFNLPLIGDILYQKGPLGGIHTALVNSPTEAALIVSCDIPLLKTHSILQLIDMHLENDAEITLATCKNRKHPLIAVYNKLLAPNIESELMAERHKVLDFVEGRDYHTLEITETHQLRNINSKEELELLKSEV